jgi:hypothetical protein
MGNSKCPRSLLMSEVTRSATTGGATSAQCRRQRSPVPAPMNPAEPSAPVPAAAESQKIEADT